MSDLRVHYRSLDKLFAAMNEVGDGGTKINAYVGAQVCSPGGFGHTAMGPIASALPIIRGAFDGGMNEFHSKWSRVEQAMYGLAEEMKHQDQDVAASLGNYAGDGGKCLVEPNEPLYTAVFNFAAIVPALEDPPPGSAQLAHPAEFKAVGAVWDKTRDTINSAIGKINSFGLVHLDKLTEESLQEMLVFPLAGNYEKIGANANACAVVDKAMGLWGDNFSRLAGRTPLAITGASGAALAAEFAAYGKIMEAVGSAVGKGAAVFQAIAKVAERMAVAIEKGLVLLGEKLVSLGAKIAERTQPLVGVLKLGWDAVTKNKHMFDDIIDDITFVIGVIDKVKSLKDDIESWAQKARSDLAEFKEVATAMARLPSATLGGPSSTRHDSGELAKRLNDINFDTSEIEDTATLDPQLSNVEGTPPPPPPPAGPAGPGGVKVGLPAGTPSG